MKEKASRAETLAGRRVLVTGGSGFLGARLLERLSGEGAEVAALSRTVRPSPSLARAVRCDLGDADATRRALQDFAPEVLFHLAAHPDGTEDYGQMESSIRVNLMGTVNLLEAFAGIGGRLFVYGDSTKVYGNGPLPYREQNPPSPTSSYAIAKGAGWDFCRLYSHLRGFSVVSVRPTMIYGPGQGRNVIGFVAESVLSGKREIPLLGGSQTRDPLFIEDALDGFLLAARSGPSLSGRVINLGGGREISVHDLARRVIELMGANVKLVIQSRMARPTEIWRSHCDNFEAEELLGFRPRHPLDEGLRITIDALRGERDRLRATGSEGQER